MEDNQTDESVCGGGSKPADATTEPKTEPKPEAKVSFVPSQLKLPPQNPGESTREYVKRCARLFEAACEDAGYSEVIVSKDWRKRFPTLSELEEGDVKMLIESVLPEGPAFLGSLSGVGKTWVALSMVKALRTGKPFLDLFKVPEKVPVAYLVPEMSGRSIRKRAEKMGIPDDDGFHCWTLHQGVLKLDDSYLKAMVEELRPVVFLDTAVRFSSGADENSSASNNIGLANAVFTEPANT